MNQAVGVVLFDNPTQPNLLEPVIKLLKPRMKGGRSEVADEPVVLGDDPVDKRSIDVLPQSGKQAGS